MQSVAGYNVEVCKKYPRPRQKIDNQLINLRVHRGYSMFDVEYEIEFTKSAPSRYIIMEMLKES